MVDSAVVLSMILTFRSEVVKMSTQVLESTPEMTAYANKLSDLIEEAQHSMALDVALSIAACIIADYGRGVYGDGYIDALREVMERRKSMPSPQIETRGQN